MWSYVSTKDYYQNKWHSHVRTCTINAVYYATVPDPTGTLSIKHEWEDEEIIIQPQERTMILFPGWTQHKPNPPKYSNEYRVAINMGYFCVTRPLLNINYCREKGAIEGWMPFGQSFHADYIAW